MLKLLFFVPSFFPIISINAFVDEESVELVIDLTLERSSQNVCGGR